MKVSKIYDLKTRKLIAIPEVTLPIWEIGLETSEEYYNNNKEEIDRLLKTENYEEYIKMTNGNF